MVESLKGQGVEAENAPDILWAGLRRLAELKQYQGTRLCGLGFDVVCGKFGRVVRRIEIHVFVPYISYEKVGNS